MEIKKDGVLGLGVQGQGITEIAARVGYDVVVATRSKESLEKGLGLVRRSLTRGVQKNRLTQEEMDAALSQIKGTISPEDFKDCDIILEAIPEIPELKKNVFRQYDELCKPETILTSDTSTIPIVELATAIKRPEKLIGTHFFWPVPVMRLVEVVVSIVTSEETVSTTMAFCESMGKTPVRVKDTPGFIVDRLFTPYLLEAIRMLQEGIATAEEIDKALELGLNYPMGPFRLMDLSGVDTSYYSGIVLYEQTKNPVYAIPTLLRDMIAAGHLGRKTGKGFYDYSQEH